jgi:hypothetical protein
VAESFGAELSLLGYSGKGTLRNSTPSDPNTFPLLFERAHPEVATAVWDHATWIPDALVFVSLSFAELDESDDALTDAYAAFVARARAVYPGTHIFLVLPSFTTDNYPPGRMARTRIRAITQETARRRAALADTRVYAYEMQPYVDGQLTGCDYHPGLALHEQMVDELTPWLRERLGW